MTLQKNKLIGAVRWTVIDRFANRLIGLIVIVILAFLLEPKDFGLVTIAALFGEMARPFIDLGFSSAIIQRKNLEPSHSDSAFWMNLLAGVCIAALALILAAPIAELFAYFHQLRKATSGPVDYSIVAQIIRWFSVGFLIAPLAGVPIAIYKRDLDFKTLAIRNLVGASLGGIVGVTMALTGCGIWSLVGHQLTMIITGTIAIYVAGNWFPKFHFSFRHVRDLFGFGASVTFRRFLTFLNQNADDILVGLFLGPVALGYYSVAYRFFRQFVQFLTGTVTQVAFPAFSKLQDDEPKLIQAFFKATGLSAVIAFPFFLGTAAIAGDVIPIIGEKWKPAIPVLQILSIVGIVHSIVMFHGYIMTSRGKPHIALVLSIVNTAFNLIAFAIAVRWGIQAVAAAFCIRALVMLPVGVEVTRTTLEFPRKEYYLQILPVIIAGLIMAAVTIGCGHLLPDGTNRFVVCGTKIAVGIFTYISVMRIVAPSMFFGFAKTILRLIDSRTKAKRALNGAGQQQ